MENAADVVRFFQFASVRLENRSRLDETAGPEFGCQRLADGVLRDGSAILVLSCAKRADRRRHGSPEKPVHHHVGVLGVHPDIDILRRFDVAGLDAEDLPVIEFRHECPRVFLVRLRRCKHGRAARHEPLPRDDELRILELAGRQPLEEVLDREFDDLDVFAIVGKAPALRRLVGRPNLGEKKIDEFSASAGRGEECRDRRRVGQLIAGFLLNFPNEALQRRFFWLALSIGGKHAGHRLDEPAAPAALFMRRKPELIDW